MIPLGPFIFIKQTIVIRILTRKRHTFVMIQTINLMHRIYYFVFFMWVLKNMLLCYSFPRSACLIIIILIYKCFTIMYWRLRALRSFLLGTPDVFFETYWIKNSFNTNILINWLQNFFPNFFLRLKPKENTEEKPMTEYDYVGYFAYIKTLSVV